MAEAGTAHLAGSVVPGSAYGGGYAGPAGLPSISDLASSFQQQATLDLYSAQAAALGQPRLPPLGQPGPSALGQAGGGLAPLSEARSPLPGPTLPSCSLPLCASVLYRLAAPCDARALALCRANRSGYTSQATPRSPAVLSHRHSPDAPAAQHVRWPRSKGGRQDPLRLGAAAAILAWGPAHTGEAALSMAG